MAELRLQASDDHIARIAHEGDPLRAVVELIWNAIDAEAEIERNYLTQTQAEHVRKVLNDVFDQLEGPSEDERKLLTVQRDKLEAERLKLVQAHYADAIPPRPPQERTRPHPRQPRPDHHPARQPHRHLRRGPNRLGPAH